MLFRSDQSEAAQLSPLPQWNGPSAINEDAGERFTDELIAEIFGDYCRENPIRMTTYQEAILWHSDKDLVPSAITRRNSKWGRRCFMKRPRFLMVPCA